MYTHVTRGDTGGNLAKYSTVHNFIRAFNMMT